MVSVVAGGPGTFLVFYLSSLRVAQAWRDTVAVSVFSVFQTAAPAPVGRGVVEVVLYTLSLFVDMYLTGYLRNLVAGAEPKLNPLSADGPGVVHRAFGPMTSITGSLLVSLLFFAAYFPARARISTSPVSFAGTTVLSVLAFLVYGAAFWVYVSCVWGVAKFGREPLRLKPFYEDRMLGLRPLGQIVVLSAVVFSVAITPTLGASLISGDALSLGINLAIVAVGISMLFLPLLGVHQRMAAVKEFEEARVGALSGAYFSPAVLPAGPDESALIKIRELLDFQRFQSLKDDASKIAEWPFEPRSVERVVAILLAIFAAILARILELPH